MMWSVVYRMMMACSSVDHPILLILLVFHSDTRVGRQPDTRATPCPRWLSGSLPDRRPRASHTQTDYKQYVQALQRVPLALRPSFGPVEPRTPQIGKRASNAVARRRPCP